MPELILILNINNEILHSFEKSLEDDTEYCKVYLLAYSCLDIIDILLSKSEKSFFYCLIKAEYISSLYIMKNGSRILIISKNKSKEEIKKKCEEVYLLYKTYFINEINEKIQSKEFIDKINKIIE